MEIFCEYLIYKETLKLDSYSISLRIAYAFASSHSEALGASAYVF